MSTLGLQLNDHGRESLTLVKRNMTWMKCCLGSLRKTCTRNGITGSLQGKEVW